jgi:hypothetical protein
MGFINVLSKNHQVFLKSTGNYYHLLNLLNEGAVAKPEMARTATFLVAPLRQCVAGGQKG